MPQTHTQEEMLKALRDHFEKTLEIPIKGKWEGSPSFSTIIRAFGSWSEALKQAGIDKDGLRKEKLITEMQKTVADLGGIVPSANDWGRNCYKPSSTFLVKIFGTWNNALLAAGLTPKPEMKSSVTEEDVLTAFKNYVGRYKIRPKVDDWREKDLQPSYTEIIRIYGTWDDALRIIELNVNATREECLQALQKFENSKGSSPFVKEWNDGNYWPSSSQIIRMFGTWNDALRIVQEVCEIIDPKDQNTLAKKECLRALLNFKIEHKKWPSAGIWRTNKLQPPASQIIQLFVKWAEALKAAKELEKSEDEIGENDEKFDQDEKLCESAERLKAGDGPHSDSNTLEFTIFQPVIYKPYLERPNLFTIKEFVSELKLPMEFFYVDEYWDAWRNPSKFIFVDEELLSWLGYGGEYKNQRQHALKNLKSNFRAEYDFVYQGTLKSASVLGAERRGQNEKLLAVTYPCLLQWTMGMATSRGREIRQQAAAQQMLFKIYSEYQSDWHARRQQLLVDAVKEENVKLRRSNARYEKKHDYVMFNIEDASYYVFSYGRRCQKDCILNHLRKHGIAIRNKRGSGPLDQRLKTHRTTFKWLMLELIITAPPGCIEILEKAMEEKFGANLNPNNSEVFEQVSLTALKDTAISMLNAICPDKYQVISQETIDAYNQDVDLLIKEGIEPIEEESKEESEEEVKENKNDSKDKYNDEKHPIINISANPNGNDNNVNVNVNIQVDLSELRSLLKDLETFTNKKLDSLLSKYDIPKHGNKDKKIEKLKSYINSKISEGAAIANKFGT